MMPVDMRLLNDQSVDMAVYPPYVMSQSIFVVDAKWCVDGCDRCVVCALGVIIGQAIYV